MIITSQYPSRVYWRMFEPGNTHYVWGNREGFLNFGDSVDDVSWPAGQFQLEVKKDGLLGPFVVNAGRLWRNDDEAILTNDGRLRPVEELVEIDLDPVKEDSLGTTRVFYDRLTSDSDITVEITSTLSVETVTTTTRSSEAGSTSSSENNIGAEGNISGKVKEVSLGLKMTGSSKTVIGTSQKLTEQYGEQIKMTQSGSEKFTEKLPAKKITMIESEWIRRFRTGQARVGGRLYPFEYPKEFKARQLTVRHYASVAEMSQEVFAEYSRLSSGRGLSTLRGDVQLVDGNGWVGLMSPTPVQTTGSISGTIYNNNAINGSWDTRSQTLRFIRNINPTYRQSWEGRPNRDGEGMIGTFFEEKGDMQERQKTYQWVSAPYLKVNGNGHPGQLRITEINANGSFKGTCYGNEIGGTWDQKNNTITFLRKVNPRVRQHWSGTRQGPLSFAGTFAHEELGSMGTWEERGSGYSWNAVAA